jgi:hypothetical protein
VLLYKHYSALSFEKILYFVEQFMGKGQLLRLSMERNTLRATTPLVSEKVAKSLVARNVLYGKELSDVYKTVEREKHHCTASFEKSKKDFIRNHDLKDSEVNAHKKFYVGSIEKETFEADFRSRSSSLPISLNLRKAKLHLNRTSSLSIENDKDKQDRTVTCNVRTPHSPLTKYTTATVKTPDSPGSPTEMQFPVKSPLFYVEGRDDVFADSQRVFDGQSLGSSPTSSQTSEVEIPEILVSEVDNDSESPQRKTSLTKRSYSTGDLPNVLAESKRQITSPCSSPVLIRRALSSCMNSGSPQESWTEGRTTPSDEKRCQSLDESFFQRFNDMLTGINVPQRPKPRPKPYSEEPFYLRKKCVLRRCLRNKSAVVPSNTVQENRDQDRERPLAAILPPIALPPIYAQQSNKSEKNKNKLSGIKKANGKINVNDARLTENLNDCRYLRNQTKR